MSKTEFVIDAGLDELVAKIIADPANSALASIREQELKVTPIMKVRSNADGEHEPNPGPPAKIQKVNDMWRLFTDAHYLLVVDYYFFNHANCVDAVIFDALCAVEVTAKEGAVKLAVKKPDINVFAATLQKFGAFDDLLLGMRDWMNEAKTKAAMSFRAKVSTGTLEEPGAETEPPTDEEPPRVTAGVPTEEPATSRRGGRSKR